jgi:hypothetical protein
MSGNGICRICLAILISSDMQASKSEPDQIR